MWRSLLIKWFPNRWVKKAAYIFEQVLNKIEPLRINPPLPNNVCIDPSTVCNLSCPLCPTGLKELRLHKQLMKFSTFSMIIDKIPTIRYLSMFNWGEPFLNLDIFKMIRYAKRKGITVGIHSNFSLKKDDSFFKEIVDSGLDKLIISFDGAKPETYSKYRNGGDFNLVYKNITHLRKYIKTTPKLICQVIANKYNEYEINNIYQMAKELKVECLIKPIRLGFDMCADWELNNTPENQKNMWLPQAIKYVDKNYRRDNSGSYRRGVCFDLFRTVVINPDGTVQPCCGITNSDNDFGDLTKQSFEEIWYGKKYRSARALFLKRNETDLIETICHNCNLYRKRQ